MILRVLFFYFFHLLDYGRTDFFRRYFERFQYQSISTQDFEAMFEITYPETWKKVNFKKWLYGTGGCPELAQLDTSLVEEAEKVADDWIASLQSVERESDEDAERIVLERFGKHGETFKSWDPMQQLCLLSTLGARMLSGAHSTRESVSWNGRAAHCMQTVYDLDSMRNSEMRFWWCRLALTAEYEPVLQNVTDFLRLQGRMKFVRPLFRDLHIVFPKGNFARNLFAEVKPLYHRLATKMIERDLAENA